MSKVDEIDGLKTKQQQLEADVDNIKESQLNLVRTNAEEVETLRKKNDELRKSLEHLERYSRGFNIRVLGVNEDEGEDCNLGRSFSCQSFQAKLFLKGN